MMPTDLLPGADQIGAPALCTEHRQAINNMAQHPHVHDHEAANTAEHLARQCPDCGGAA